MVEKFQVFKDLTFDSKFAIYNNAYAAVGILKEPLDHSKPAINTVWFVYENFEVGDTHVDISLVLTEGEARTLMNCLKYALDNHDKYYKPVTDPSKPTPREVRESIDSLEGFFRAIGYEPGSRRCSSLLTGPYPA